MNREQFLAFANRPDITREELPHWFATVAEFLQTAYVQAATPWQQSGKGGSFAEWTRLRIPIIELFHKDGSFLDIGCANGFLLQCVEQWTAHIPQRMDLHGMDIGPELVKLAQARLPHGAANLHHGNSWDWVPPQRYDFLRTELVYVPRAFYREYVLRLLRDLVAIDGRLIIAHYRGRTEDLTGGWHGNLLQGWGIPIADTAYGYNREGLLMSQFYAIDRAAVSDV